MTRNLDWIGLVVNIWVPWESENLFIGSESIGCARLLSCDFREATEGPWDYRSLANSHSVAYHASPISASMTHTTHSQSPPVWLTTHQQSLTVSLTPRINNLSQCHSPSINNLLQCRSPRITISASMTHTMHHQSPPVWLTPRITNLRQYDSHHTSTISHNVTQTTHLFVLALRPNAGHGLLILDVSRSHTTTHHSR